MIKITDFIEKYNSFNSETAKENYLNGFLKNKYAPLVNKQTVLQLSLDRSIVDKDGILYINMLANKINFIASVMVLYTDIIAEKDSNGKTKTYEFYDLVIENGILDKIYKYIGKQELDELISVNKMLIDTFHEENSTFPAYISRIITGLGVILKDVDLSEIINRSDLDE